MRSLLFALVLCCYTEAQLKSNEKIVAQQVFDNGNRSLLVEDSDDFVYQLALYKGTGGTQRVLTGTFGNKVEMSGSVNLSRILPPKEVATGARRVTMNSGTVVHAVLAWGMSDIGGASAYATLYILNQPPKGDIEVVLKEYLGPEIKQFALVDLNGDGFAKVIVISHEGKYDTARLFQLLPDGRVIKIQEISDEEVSTVLVRWPGYEGGGIVTSRFVDCPSKGGECIKRSSYAWSAMKKKYVLEE